VVAAVRKAPTSLYARLSANRITTLGFFLGGNDPSSCSLLLLLLLLLLVLASSSSSSSSSWQAVAVAPLIHTAPATAAVVYKIDVESRTAAIENNGNQIMMIYNIIIAVVELGQ